MNINIYKHEFRANLKSVITWSASLASLLFVFTALFPSMARDAALLNETLAQMPPASGVALGFDRLVMLATGARRIADVLWTPPV